MELSEWLTQAGITRKRFAEMIGVVPAHITGLCDGSSWPSRRVARRIFDATNGEVTSQDFLFLEKDPAA